MGTIDFPDKDPEEWKLFYAFIHPRKIGETKHNAAQINTENVLKLLPWFHEFQMDGYVKECDNYLAQNYFREDQKYFWKKKRRTNETEARHQTRLEKRKDKFDAILSVLHLSRMYDLKFAKDAMGRTIAALMNMPLQTDDLFDFFAVKSLLLFIHPLELNETGLRMSGGECRHLLLLFEKILSPHTSMISQEMINDTVTFPHLFYCYMQIKIEQERTHAEKEEKEKAQASATSIINKFIHQYPSLIHNQLPNKKTLDERIGIAGERCFRQVLSRHYKRDEWKFQCLGITLPSKYL